MNTEILKEVIYKNELCIYNLFPHSEHLNKPYQLGKRTRVNLKLTILVKHPSKLKNRNSSK